MNDGPAKDEFHPDILFRQPDLYMLEFNGPNAVLVRMTEDTYRRSIFTDRQRIVTASPDVLGVSTDKLMGLYEAQDLPQPKISYVFHVAHCGSTLLARALDQSPELLVYREPSPLRQLAAEFVASANGPPSGARWSQRLKLATGLLGRSYKKSQATIVKANVPVNFIVSELMDLNPNSCGILLYAPLRGYLLSVLKSPQHQRWVGFIVRELAHGIKGLEQLADVVPERLSPPQAAACIWLAQMLIYRQLAESTERVRTLDCEFLFDHPQASLEAAFDFFGVDVSSDEIRQLVAGELFSHHSKAPGVRYDNAARKAELDRLAISLGDQIDAGTAWVSERLSESDVPGTLPNPLA